MQPGLGVLEMAGPERGRAGRAGYAQAGHRERDHGDARDEIVNRHRWKMIVKAS